MPAKPVDVRAISFSRLGPHRCVGHYGDDDTPSTFSRVESSDLRGVIFDARLTSKLSLNATSYYHRNQSKGSWVTPHVATSTGAPGPGAHRSPAVDPIPFRTTGYEIDCAVNITRATLETRANALDIGDLYESTHSIRRAASTG